MRTTELSYTRLEDHDFLEGRRVDWTIREPDQLEVEETLLIVPGIMAKRRAYDPYARRLAEYGLRSVTMSHETGTMFCADEVIEVKNRLAEMYDQPVRVAGHSLGGLHATEAVARDSESVSGLLLLQPAGFGGVNPLRAPESIMSERDNRRVIDEIRMAADGLKYAIKGRAHFVQTVLRAASMIDDETIASLPDDIDRTAIVFANDKLINARLAGANLERAGFSVAELGGEVKSGHNAQYYRAADVGQLTLQIIKREQLAA